MDKPVTSIPALAKLLGSDRPRDVYTEQILFAARKLLSQQGMRQTSLADIAAAAGCSERTLYRRFADRNALLRAVFFRELDHLRLEVDERLRGVTQPDERAVAAFVVFARTIQSHQLLRRLLVTDPDQILPLMTTAAEPILRVGISWMMTYMGEEPFAADPRQIAEILIRIGISLAVTPSPTLSFATDEEAAALARSVFVPLLQRTAPEGS